LAITNISTFKVPKKLKHQIVKAVPKKCKKISISDEYFKKDGYVNPHQKRVKIYRLDNNKGVKKFTLTEFGKYMNTVQCMDKDRVEEQKKDCFNYLPIPQYPQLFNYN
jgi:hypothetical protein